ncbi:hypothetical protein P4V41_02685 [Fictibacillus nanhaiensis]|uniref:hypothetical protein n=1 Tax=Fictibacillus nanhaiensis TaxID=742169 RepID=UPI002E24A973|nr:hypothetical protein [Fictibacillus nanhaiensis]
MLSINTLPKHIKTSLDKFNTKNEKPDVFPSIFYIRGNKYYYFTFAPSEDELIMLDDGTIPSLKEINYVALLANSYNSAVNSIAFIGYKWVKSKTKRNYLKLYRLLQEVKDEFCKINTSAEINQSLIKFIETTESIVKDQDNIENAVEAGTRKVQETSKAVKVTEFDYIELRNINLQMVRAAHQQNTIQLESEQDRNKVFNYLDNQSLFSNLKLSYLKMKLQPYRKLMLSSESEQAKEVREMHYVMEDDVPFEENPLAPEALARFKNPR